jgi:hypothetical protein
MAGQELRSPRRHSGAAFEHGHQTLALAEGRIQRREVGDLQRHDHDPYGPGGHVEGDVLGAAWVDGAYGEERTEGLAETVRQVVGGRLQHEAESDDEGGRPEEELGD